MIFMAHQSVIFFLGELRASWTRDREQGSISLETIVIAGVLLTAAGTVAALIMAAINSRGGSLGGDPGGGSVPTPTPTPGGGPPYIPGAP